MRSVLITGGNSSLGRVVAKKLVGKGYFVYIGVRDLRHVKVNPNMQAVLLDVTDDKQIAAVVSKIKKHSGNLCALVNLAAVTSSKDSGAFSRSEFQEMLNVNVVSPLCLANACVPIMDENSKIVNITSLNGLVPLPRFSTYSASKHALEALGIAMRSELSHKNIWVTNIAPGAIRSDVKKSSKVEHKTARERYPILKYILAMCTEESVAEKVVEVIQSDSPRARIVIGSDAKITYFLYRVVPSRLWDMLIRKILY